MGDSAVWVAAFTGGTAVLASWVATMGSVRAARVQAEETARAQHRLRVRELRRAAYLELMERSHAMGELYRQVVDAYFQLAGSERFLTRCQEIRGAVREAYDPLLRGVRVVRLEGPAQVAEAAQAVLAAATEVSRALWHVCRGEPEARVRFDAARDACLVSLDRFAETARAVMDVA
ncbi:hypothetical protein [Streptomyces sp. NPDC020996]|uniref:hypothetical protein n=1 Tax=Streptomyces sp. NPDC020996 TaxID=3154791 RepID=UPI003402809F